MPDTQDLLGSLTLAENGVQAAPLDNINQAATGLTNSEANIQSLLPPPSTSLVDDTVLAQPAVDELVPEAIAQPIQLLSTAIEPEAQTVAGDPLLGTMAIASIKIEAENITDVTGYRLENRSIASGGQLLSLVGGQANEVGSATFAFSGATGTYNIKIATFDENDGQANLEIRQNGLLIDLCLTHKSTKCCVVWL